MGLGIKTHNMSLYTLITFSPGFENVIDPEQGRLSSHASLLPRAQLPQADLQLWLGGLAVSEQPRGAVAHLQARRGLPGEFLCPSQGVQPWGATSDPGRGGGEVLRSVCTRDAHSR